MSDTLFATEETAPKSKRVPPKNEIIGYKRADGWDQKLEQIAGESAGTHQAVETIATSVATTKTYIIATAAVLLLAQVLIAFFTK